MLQQQIISIITFVIISTSFYVTARRQLDDDDEADTNLDNLYSIEDDTPFAKRFVSLKGGLRQSFALVAAIDRHDENMVCSPLSALLPLGKLAIGAKDEALDELLLTIGVSRKRKLKSHFMELIENLQYIQGVQLDVASRIYVSKTTNLYRKFLDRSKYIFGSSAEKVDFDNPTEAAYIINTWKLMGNNNQLPSDEPHAHLSAVQVTKKTNGMIKDLVSPSQISSSTSLVLVNAIYFAGQWKEPFGNIKVGTFYTPHGEKQVTMMSRNSWFNYARSSTLGAQLIEVPYQGDGASFIILLPYKKNGLPALLSQLKLAPDLLDIELSKMRKLKIMLTMPKFKIETKLNLVELYRKIGLENIFDPHGSGLKKIVRNQSVFVSEATHKAVIEVTELGTEAAAASVVQIIGVSLDIHRQKMICEYPFLFYVVSDRQQLFAGIVHDP